MNDGEKKKFYEIVDWFNKHSELVDKVNPK